MSKWPRGPLSRGHSRDLEFLELVESISLHRANLLVVDDAILVLVGLFDLSNLCQIGKISNANPVSDGPTAAKNYLFLVVPAALAADGVEPQSKQALQTNHRQGPASSTTLAGSAAAADILTFPLCLGSAIPIANLCGTPHVPAEFLAGDMAPCSTSRFSSSASAASPCWPRTPMAATGSRRNP